MSWRELGDFINMKGVSIPESADSPGKYQQIAVLNVLASHANKEHVTFISAYTIAEILACSRRSVRNCLNALELYGLIERTRSEKKKGASVHYRVLPNLVPVDNSQHGGDTRLLGNELGGQLGGQLGGELGGELGGDTRLELELEREHKPPREKFAKTPKPLAAQYPEAEKKKRIIAEAIAMNFELIEPTRKPGAGLMSVKRGECAAIWAELTSKYERTLGVALDLNNLDESKCALFVAMGLAGENLRPGDIAQMIHH